MIEDARSISDGTRLECDVCIVGAGPAGIALALELAPTSARICVLEAGGLSYERASQALLDGEVIGDSYPSLRDARFAGLGGAGGLWAGWCRPLDAIDFAERPWVQGSGWPFPLEELLPAYHRAHELCHIGPFDYDPRSWSARTGERCLPLASDAVGVAMFHVSPVRFGQAYRQALATAPNVRVLLHAVASRCHAAPGEGMIERVAVGTLAGRRFDVTARCFVLAAGGVENARLLLLSGDSPADAIGNADGLVGRYFTEHPFIEPGSFVPRDPAASLRFYFPARAQGLPPGAAVRGAFTLTAAALERRRLLNGAMFFLPAYEAHPVFADPAVRSMLELWEKVRGRGVPGEIGPHLARIARSPWRVAHAALRRATVRPGRTARWRLRGFFECESLADNRVTLGPGRDDLGRPLPELRWRMSELDVASMRRSWLLLGEALAAAGHGRLELDWPDTPEAWRGAARGGKHHMGTTRMHVSPRRGVVDADGRVHGTSNLFVAGSSVFPTGGFANPTLTIVALAVRLAGHLRRAGWAVPG